MIIDVHVRDVPIIVGICEMVSNESIKRRRNISSSRLINARLIMPVDLYLSQHYCYYITDKILIEIVMALFKIYF